MQKRLNATIDKLNETIINLNIEANMKTPCLHTSIMRRRGQAGHGYYIYRWNLFADGLHANDQLLEDWARALKVALKKNRENDYSDDECQSKKRSWRREKRPRLT